VKLTHCVFGASGDFEEEISYEEVKRLRSLDLDMSQSNVSALAPGYEKDAGVY
jgi:hypothetical protein